MKGAFPDLVACDHSGYGLSTGIVSFRRPPTRSEDEVNVMVALCPACTELVYKALKELIPLRSQ